jgi:exosortase family protein XrtM
MQAMPRFTLLFLALFTVLVGGFEALRGTGAERFLVETVILQPTRALIGVLTPAEHVVLFDRSLISPVGPTLRVTRGCEGVELLLLLLAAILAFPASMRHRLQGLLWGSLLAYALSITRLVLLHYTLTYYPGLWQALHGLVLPLAPIVLLALYFLHWSGAASSTTCAAPDHAT